MGVGDRDWVVTVSVVIRTFNRCDLLMNRAIPSVVAQTVSDWECHVIGDGTDDATVEAMTALCASDHRFRFTNLPRQHYGEADRWTVWGLLGLDALNLGLDTALGEWIAVLDDDDEFMPEHHEILIEAALKERADFAYGKSVTPWGQEYGKWPPGDGSLTQGSYVYCGRARDYRYDLNCLRDRGLNGDADMWTRMYAEGVQFTRVKQMVHRYYPSVTRAGA